jgi:MFS family permease
MRRARVAVSVGFLFFGVTAGSLLPRLPAIKDGLHLSDGQIGFAFLAFAVGAVIAAAGARLLLARGARLPVRIGVFALCVLLIGPGVAPTYTVLVAVFLVTGLFAGASDVLMNSQAAEIEREAGRPMINSFHAYWSLGSIVGSIIAVAAAALLIPPSIQFGVVGILLAVASVPLVAAVPDTRGGAAALIPADAARWHVGAAVVVLAMIALVAVAVEGAGMDWSAIYLRDFGHASQGVAALGFAVMAVTMTAVRFTADRLTALTSPRAMVALGAAVVAAGFGLAVAFPEPWVLAIAGFGLVGAGTAVLFPLAMSASANLDAAGTTLSLVTAAGYAGSVVVPPLIGGAADRFGLQLALLIPMAFALVVVGLMAGTRVLPTSATRRFSDATEGVEREA